MGLHVSVRSQIADNFSKLFKKWNWKEKKTFSESGIEKKHTLQLNMGPNFSVISQIVDHFFWNYSRNEIENETN